MMKGDYPMAKNMEKQKLREANELRKWHKMQNKPLAKHYFAIMIVVLTIIYIVDEVATNICGTVTTNITFDLFHIADRDITSDEYTNAANQMAVLGILPLLFQFIAPFYKSLADKYGRRLFLAINTVGMALGMFAVMIAPNPLVYAIGLSTINFVVPNDVQVLYIMESVEAEHRAKYCNIAKAFGILGISSIGILRTIFINEADPTSWRMVFLIPVILAAFVGTMSVFFLRETPVFLSKRIRYLSTSEEEKTRQAAQENAKAMEQKGGVGSAIRFIFKNKQLRYLAICAILFSFTSVATSYNNNIMVGGGMSEGQISTAIMVYPVVYAILTALSGFYSDKKGRKTTCLAFGTLSMVCLILFVLATKFANNGVLVGLLYGGFVGGLWSTGDTLLLTLPQESAPTSLRASVVGVFTLTLVIGLVGVFGVAIAYNFFRDYGWLCFLCAVPFMAISLLLLKTKVHETRGVDLDAVTGEEWN